MSASNCSIITLLVNQTDIIAILNERIRFYGYLFGIPIMATIGFIMNTFCLLAIVKFNLKGDYFKFQIVKLIIHNLVLFALAISPYTNCQVCSRYRTLEAELVRFIGLILITSCGYTSASILEIILAYDQLVKLKKNSKYLIKVPFKCSLLFLMLIGVGLNAPNMLAYTIGSLNNNSEKYSIALTNFGRSAFYLYYTIVVNFLQSLFTFFVLALLNGLIFFYLKTYINKNSVIINANAIGANEIISTVNFNAKRLSKNIKKQFTIVILIGSVIFMISRLVQLIASIIYEFNRFNNVQSSVFSLLYSFFNISFTTIVFSLNFILNFIFNKKFKYTFIKYIEQSFACY
jgi:hypothetical protein